MTEKNNKVCVLCHRPYRYCPSCMEFKTLPKWMILFDKDNCHEIFNIVAGYNQKTTSLEDARERLLNQDLSEMGLYDIKVRETIEKIIGVTEEPVAESLYNKEETHPEMKVDEDTVFVRSPKRRQKKNKNVEQ